MGVGRFRGTGLMVAALVLACGAAGAAELMLPAIFSDNAVLSRSDKTAVFGKADPGAKVTAALGDAKAQATADAQGRWIAYLDLKDSAPGPFELVVAVDKADKPFVAKNVLVGEVWLCSGQSNMAWTLNNTIGAKEEMAASANPRLRQFKVANASRDEPVDTLKGSWQIAGPGTARGFTAVGYFFGKELVAALDAPVGLINSSWGGTPVESWTSIEALNARPELKKVADSQLEAHRTFEPKLKDYLANLDAWKKQFGREDRKPVPVPADAEWQQVKLPGAIPGNGGAVVLRRAVTVGKDNAGKQFPINLGMFYVEGEAFWNGTSIGKVPLTKAGFGDGYAPFHVPPALVKEGEAELTVRLYSPFPRIRVERDLRIGGALANGQWDYRYEFELPALSQEAKDAQPKHPGNRPRHHNLPATLYNGMIHPFLPYGLRGVIWYQGENNAGNGLRYQTAFPALIEDWRARFEQGDFPFYWCQLANYQGKTDQPGARSAWAELREAQSMTLSLPNTGEAILIDLGEGGDIHPRNKLDVGHRLAVIALAKTYGRADTPYSGPTFKRLSIEGNKARLSFNHVDGGLVARPVPDIEVVRGVTNETRPLVRNSPASQLEGFAIAGADDQWQWAEATIEGNDVVVWSDKVATPTQVRYAWANNPTCNLYNGAGFPATPFRTGK